MQITLLAFNDYLQDLELRYRAVLRQQLIVTLHIRVFCLLLEQFHAS